MTGSAYAAGWPWAGAQRNCGDDFFENLKRELQTALNGRRGHRGGHQGFGGPQWGMFGGQHFGPPPWVPRGPKARRGDVRAAILAVLAEQPMNGYQIIQEIAERSGGAWKPSPGSIYPTLQQLEDEGLVTADAATGRRTFTLTDEGRAYVAEHADEVAAPWEAMSAPPEADDNGLKPMLGQVATAMWQVMSTGTPEQQAQAKEAVAELRRKLYAILVDDRLADDRPADEER
ncbi:PadR family transcriptional regulator [Kribbella antibiotica]|uniref:PadR family transcriptional regulator n=1 Tax=Kribbella antibiotica TaxID=190195 RepID=A0A4R4ZSH5_9ACTN|nr:PadR family transcriptional regulator [Kribbella antibiotica]TDD61991.1 PadR family transcriptional regulator [Kribbella antibiotica]